MKFLNQKGHAPYELMLLLLIPIAALFALDLVLVVLAVFSFLKWKIIWLGCVFVLAIIVVTFYLVRWIF